MHMRLEYQNSSYFSIRQNFQQLGPTILQGNVQQLANYLQDKYIQKNLRKGKKIKLYNNVKAKIV